MSRTPTYVRLNGDELADIPVFPDAFVTTLHAQGKLLLIEDDRPERSIVKGEDWQDWIDAADKVRFAGRTIKDNHAPIDPTERRGLGRFG